MADPALCETICKESGGLAEVLVILLLAARTLYTGWRNRQLKTQTVSLQEKVADLSMRPPPVPVVLQLSPHPSMSSLVPTPVPPTPPAAAELDAPDPDHVDPPRS